MKKFIISLLLLTPFLTGCTNIDTQLTINDDKSASIVTSLTYEGNIANKSDKIAQTVEDNYRNFLDPMYKIDTAYGSKLSTITASKSVKNLQHNDLDLSSLGFTSNLADGRFVQVKKNFLVTSYNIDATYDLKKQISRVLSSEKAIEQAQPKGLQPEYLQKYGDTDNLTPSDDKREDFIEHLDEDTKVFTEKSVNNEDETQNIANNDLNLSFSIKVPTFASYNNADNVNLNVYSWDISADEPTVIKFQYVRYSGLAVTFMILAGIACLILLARRIVKRESQKRIDN